MQHDPDFADFLRTPGGNVLNLHIRDGEELLMNFVPDGVLLRDMVAIGEGGDRRH